MATEVKMPQMGESIAEGTITKWLKQKGDTVETDEPLFEISTDKVDAEIPSPTSGTLTEIVVGEGETVEVHTVVAKIDEEGEGSSDEDDDSAEEDEAKADEEQDEGDGEDDGEDAEKKKDEKSDEAEAKQEKQKKAEAEKEKAEKKKAEKKDQKDQKSDEEKAEKPDDEKKSGGGDASREERIKTKSSPLVRKIASEHDVDITKVEGSGVHGRVTKDDILAYIEGRDEKGGEKRDEKGEGEKEPTKKAPAAPKHEAPEVPVGAGDSVEPMGRMRKLIAEHMVQSKQTAAHVHSMHEVDMSRIDAIRAKHKKRFAEANGGAKLTYTVFIAKAVVDALREMPVVNASVSGDDVVYHGDVNLGMAVALDWGLIVPVIKKAQDLSMSGLAKSIADIANRARNKRLKPDEVEGSTFSVTNYGAYGGLMGTPVINQPNSAILGVGTIEKRVVVVDDMITIRPRMFLTLGYDHRLIDGAVAGQFLLHLKNTLENFDETAL